MKLIFKTIYFIYQWFFFMPLMIVATILTAIITMLMCSLFNDRFWGFYPAKIWSRFACYFSFVKVKVSGRENINPTQSYVFVANHQSLFDIFAIYGWLNIPFKWIMKKELEKIPFVGKACKSAGHIFITRGQSKAALKSIEEAKKKLINGLSVVIFPEGSRTYTGAIGNFKRGAFQLASDLQLPIVPISIKGAFDVMPRTSFNINPTKIELIIYPPIDTNLYINNQQELIDMVKKEIENGI
jgi:1-acyl-sn-glycerol-3-phosphate acyltransferase